MKVDNAQMLIEIGKSQERSRVTEKLGTMIIDMVDSYARKPSFNGYTDIEDYKGEAIIVLMESALKFDPNKSDNPFSYLTTCLKNSLLQSIENDKKKIWDAKQNYSEYIKTYGSSKFNG